jgi:hypothetical protein
LTEGGDASEKARRRQLRKYESKDILHNQIYSEPELQEQDATSEAEGQ